MFEEHSELEGTQSSRHFIHVQPQRLNLDHPAANERYLALASRIRDLIGHNPRPGQVECIRQLLDGNDDVLLQAATGYGKSAIWQCTGLLSNYPALTIMISPLNSLTQQHARTVNNLCQTTGKAIGIDQYNNTDEVLRDVGDCVYTHVCVSPEIACSLRFSRLVLQSEKVRDRRIFLMIDEAHCIDVWRTFRKDYGKLNLLRQYLPRNAVSFGTSATLDPDLRQRIMREGPFLRDVTFIDTSTDRPEIFIEIRRQLGTRVDMEDLHFLFPFELDDDQVQTLRKTIIFFDDRRDIRNALEIIRRWLMLAGASSDMVNAIVKPYFASIPLDEKEAMLLDFESSTSIIRVLLATDAVGMGIELQGIEIVVQFPSEKHFEDVRGLGVIVQRMGRAARQAGEKGDFIWLVPAWTMVKDDQVTNLSQTVSKTSVSDLKGRSKNRQKRAALDPVFQAVLRGCPRRALMQHFHGPDSEIWSLPRFTNNRCCYLCQPNEKLVSLARYTVPVTRLRMNVLKKFGIAASQTCIEQMVRLPREFQITGNPRYYGPLVRELRTWRQNTVQSIIIDTPDVAFDPYMLLSDPMIERLALMADWLVGDNSRTVYCHFLQTWAYHMDYQESILRLIQQVVDRRIFEYPRQFEVKEKEAERDRQLSIQKIHQKRLESSHRDNASQRSAVSNVGIERTRLERLTMTELRRDKRIVHQQTHKSPMSQLQSLESTLNRVYDDNMASLEPKINAHERNPIDDISDTSDWYFDELSENDQQKARYNRSRSQIKSPITYRRRVRNATASQSALSDSGKNSPARSEQSTELPAEAFETRRGRVSKSSQKALGQRRYMQNP